VTSVRGLRGSARTTRLVAAWLAALVLGILAVLTPGLASSPVLADCATIKDVPAAQRSGDAVFVGDVYRTENDGRWAVVLVDERWQGAAGLPDTVEVHGGPGPGTLTTTDRAFTEGRWLFDVTNAGPYYADSSCSASQPWTDDLSQFRPAGVTESKGSGSSSPLDVLESSDIVLIAVLVGALLIAILAYILILRRRRRPPEWMR
jgi:hypothetical protein